METATLDAKAVKLDEEGFLVDYTQWNEDLARQIAAEEGIPELTDQHWKVIHFMRKEYQEKGEVPTIRRLKKTGGIPTKELYALFPNGPAKKAARIAGLPKPKGCV